MPVSRKTHHVDHDVVLLAVHDHRFVFVIFLQKAVPLLVLQVLLHIVDCGEHQAILAE